MRRLDGLPLAIELAAARLRSMPVEQIAARLTDRFRLLTGGSRTALPRHRTLLAVVEWSWELLSEDERRLARRLAVFVGGITVASAADVCASSDLPEDAVEDLLGSLVDKSLLQLVADQGRYRMLETLREFGLERMAELGEVSAIRARPRPALRRAGRARRPAAAHPRPADLAATCSTPSATTSSPALRYPGRRRRGRGRARSRVVDELVLGADGPPRRGRHLDRLRAAARATLQPRDAVARRGAGVDQLGRLDVDGHPDERSSDRLDAMAESTSELDELDRP